MTQAITLILNQIDYLKEQIEKLPLPRDASAYEKARGGQMWEAIHKLDEELNIIKDKNFSPHCTVANTKGGVKPYIFYK